MTKQGFIEDCLVDLKPLSTTFQLYRPEEIVVSAVQIVLGLTH
jgi:hypothetical protein